MSDLLDDGWKTLNEAWKFTKRTAMSTPEMEIKVEEATSNEEWGPSSSQLLEIASSSYRYSDLPLIMSTLYRRIQDTGKNWRHVYKSLVVMDYLLKHGSDDGIRSMRAHSLEIQQLTHFHYIDEHKDVGQAIRSKAKAVLELIHDEAKLREERDKAKKNRGKYQGYGSDTPGAFRGGYEDEYERSPYARRPEQSPSQTYRSDPRKDLSDSDEDSGEDSDSEKRTTTTSSRPVSRPRAPSDERERGGSSASRKTVPAPTKPSFNLVDLEVESFPPSLPPPVGGGGGGSGLTLFEAFPPTSGGGGGTFGAFPPTATTPSPIPLTTPTRPTPTPEEEWDAFKSFETPKDQSDIWYQHKSLFNLQHLNNADPKTAQPKQPDNTNKPLGAMLAEKQKNSKPGPTLGGPTLGQPTRPPLQGQGQTFAPFGPATSTPVIPPATSSPLTVTPPAFGTPTLGTPMVTGQPYMGQPAVYPGYGGMPVGYPAGYAPAMFAPMGATALPATGGMAFTTPYKAATTTGAK